MKIDVKIIKSNTQSTLSEITVDGKFVCFGLEDGFKEVKVKGKTRIPRKLYSVGVKKVGGFHKRYSDKFKPFHKGMLQIEDVEGFTDILIHIGNTSRDTEGCLLVGYNANTFGKISVGISRLAYIEFYNLVIDEALKGNLVIEFIDND